MNVLQHFKNAGVPNQPLIDPFPWTCKPQVPSQPIICGCCHTLIYLGRLARGHDSLDLFYAISFNLSSFPQLPDPSSLDFSYNFIFILSVFQSVWSEGVLGVSQHYCITNEHNQIDLNEI